MNIHLSPSKLKSSSHITITGSKSETNRLLLLQALFPELELKNTSNSDDSEVMFKALSQILEPTTHHPPQLMFTMQERPCDFSRLILPSSPIRKWF